MCEVFQMSHLAMIKVVASFDPNGALNVCANVALTSGDCICC